MFALVIVISVFALLAIVIPLLEKANKGKSSTLNPRLAKLILPLVAISLVMKLIYMLASA
ncbi:hypothetical protein PALB_6300 [Pseudoalteromonas luteoviolacea B = ATCC 29581]|nr:hypothetical protein PALB_6300 [Pseudoalteromonas luteoviolacea B = ATCC 29581]